MSLTEHYISVDGFPVEILNAQSVDSRFQELTKACPHDLVMKHPIRDADHRKRVEAVLRHI